ncbi:NUDIX hydrolase [Enterococcus mundtii]|uniref:NUDIX hydrolase n=1 Tax=Enterococcus mundtii TaxID=53346 RepID=UPI001CCE02BC|nr:NUDIX hydrolase [Enterococcus mundtii]UBM05798.1 NUDIX hydrolase [Enterococcus mundtii]
MLEYEQFEEKTIQRKEIYHGAIIDVAVDDVRLPDGNIGKRELVFHPGGVGIIAFDEKDRLLLVKQFRKPLEKVILEIPAGKIDPGEKQAPEITAARELEEETGYRAERLDHLTSMYLSPGFANEFLRIYHAVNIEKVEQPLAQDEDEVLELYALTLAEAKQAMSDQVICDAKTIYAIQYWESMNKGK